MRNLTILEFEAGLSWLRTYIQEVHERHGRAFRPVLEAPETLEAVTAAWSQPGLVPVWNGASTDTLYGGAQNNYAFRAWHDTVHAFLQTPFTPDGEKVTAMYQVRQVLSCYDLGDVYSRRRAARLVFEDIVGQVQHYERHKAFPVDQLAFQRAYATQGAALALSRAR